MGKRQSAMWAFIIRNILQRIVLLVIVSIIAHSIIHLAPGEPSEVDPANPRMKAEDIARIRPRWALGSWTEKSCW